MESNPPPGTPGLEARRQPSLTSYQPTPSNGAQGIRKQRSLPPSGTPGTALFSDVSASLEKHQQLARTPSTPSPHRTSASSLLDMCRSTSGMSRSRSTLSQIQTPTPPRQDITLLSGGEDLEPPGILNTIADEGSTAWMNMPDDVLSPAAMGASFQQRDNDEYPPVSSNDGGRLSRRRSRNARAAQKGASLPLEIDGVEDRAQLEASDDGEYEGLHASGDTMGLPESWLDSAIQQTGAGSDTEFPSMLLSRGGQQASSATERDICRSLSEDSEEEGQRYHQQLGRELGPELDSAAMPSPTSVSGSTRVQEWLQGEGQRPSEGGGRPPSMHQTVAGADSESVSQPGEERFWADTDEDGRASRQGGGDGGGGGSGRRSADEYSVHRFRASGRHGRTATDCSSESSVDLDACTALEESRWQTLRINISQRSMDPVLNEGVTPSEISASSRDTEPSDTTPTTATAANGVRHQRSRTLDMQGDSFRRLSAAPSQELSTGRSGPLPQYNYPASETTGTSVLEQEANQLAFSALALSPRTESGFTAAAAGSGPHNPPDMALSYRDGLRLNAMLAALATGGTLTDVLAAAEIPPDARATPPSPTPLDRKPGAALRADAHTLLKVLRNNPAESPDVLRKLILLSEQPSGPEAIAKEGGLDMVVMVMSSEWANRMIAVMCAELLRVLLPGAIAMSRRKLLKRLPELGAGALSGVDGVLPPEDDPLDSGAEGQNSRVTLTKKHLKKLRKRSTSIAWACHALVRMMERFQSEESVQDKGSSALWGVLSPRNEPQSMAHREIDNYIQRVAATEVLEAGGVFVLMTNLKQHAGHANVAYSAVGALLAIAQLGPQGRKAIERQNGREAIRAAMTDHPAIGYRGRFASLAGWLEDTSTPDDSGLRYYQNSDGGTSSSQMDDDDMGSTRERGREEWGSHMRAHKRMSLKRFSRRAPIMPPGASSLASSEALTDIDLKHIRMNDDKYLKAWKVKVGAEEKLWNRFMNAIGGGWTRKD